ncbi:MAG: amidohydrolase, partial [Corynebacterium pollutisoli]|nr:amidohydrolase [Corynebacterium pollutisoli]
MLLAPLTADLAATRADREELHRWFHRNPELSGQEHATSQRILTELLDAGIAARRVGATGVLAVVGGGVTRVRARRPHLLAARRGAVPAPAPRPLVGYLRRRLPAGG